MKEVEMQNHLVQILKKYNLRRGLVNKLVVNPLTFIFRDDADEELRWSYYNSVCKELKIKNKIIRLHGMDSEKAATKKNDGHMMERFFEMFGCEVVPGVNKTDLIKDGNVFASVKGGKKIQWGMHVLNKLPERFQLLFGNYISSFEKNSVYYTIRRDIANSIISHLDNRDSRFDLLNYFFRKDEEVPYLIVKDCDSGIYYRIKYIDLINVLCDNISFYTTKDKVKIVSRILIKKKPISLFDIETRSDKGNALLMHGKSKVIIDIINNFKINVEETYQQNSD